MHRALLFLSVLTAAFGLTTTGARAQACLYAPGQYVGVEWAGETGVPAIVLTVNPDCTYTARLLVLPEKGALPQPFSFRENRMAPLAGPPPYDKPFGCTYAPDEAVDVRGGDGEWHAGVVRATEPGCSILAAYQDATGREWPVTIDILNYDRLRPGTLAPLTQQEIDEAQACTGETVATVAADDADAAVKRSVLAAIAERETGELFATFETIRQGTPRIIAENSTFLQQNPDAVPGATLAPFRTELSICTTSVLTGATRRRASIDFNCFNDAFGDFVCRKFAERPL